MIVISIISIPIGHHLIVLIRDTKLYFWQISKILSLTLAPIVPAYHCEIITICLHKVLKEFGISTVEEFDSTQACINYNSIIIK